MTSKYWQGAAESEGAHQAESEAIGRLRELAAEYAGTDIGADYERQWRAALPPFPDAGGSDYTAADAAEEDAAFAQDARPFRC